MAARTPAPLSRLVAALGADAGAVRQSTAALALSACTSVVAGLALGAATDQLERLPGLLLLVPAAIGLRGNIFGALGSRLGTAIHTGTFTTARRADTIVGQNVVAAMVLTLVLSVVTALMASAVGIGVGLTDLMSPGDMVTVSVLGGVAASLVIVVITLLLSAGSVRLGWDLDIVAGPVVSAAGDVVTLPALVLASHVAGHGGASEAAGAVLTAVALGVLVAARRSRLVDLVAIVRESVPVLAAAGLLDLLAGVVIEKRLASLAALPALLVLLPGFLSSAGSLGSILSNRLGTKLHLGLVTPGRAPDRAARAEMAAIVVLAVPTFLLTALAVHVGASAAGLAGPGVGRLVAVAMLGGALTTVLVVAVAYYGTAAAVRLGLDPDTIGTPLVTSSLDLVGAFALILAIVALGVV